MIQVRSSFSDRLVPVSPRTLVVATLVAAITALTMAPRAPAAVVALDPYPVSAPVLWNGGVAWQDLTGVHAGAPGAPPRALVSFHPLGYTFAFALDSGAGGASASGAGVNSATAGDSNGASVSSATAGGSSGASAPARGSSTAGALAYGWEEANEMTPPMGPGDTSVPSPSLPYETSIVHRGVISASGTVTQLPVCGTEDVPVAFGAYGVSLTGTTVAYRCEGAPPGAPVPASPLQQTYLALGEIAAPSTPTRTIVEASAFQISGDYVAYYAAGKPAGSGHMVVESRQTGTVSYEVPVSTQVTIALQADGTLVLLGAGTSACAPPGTRSGQTYPAEWFSPASPLAHQLGCFYDGSLRPAGGQWVALRPGPSGAEASLVLLSLASGASRPLASFPNAGVFEPQQQPLGPGADFDGTRLAWTQQTCAGTAVEFTPDVSAMSPTPPPSARCPVVFHVHGQLHPTAAGAVRVSVSCPQGCPDVELSVARPRALQTGSTDISLPASARARTESIHLSRRQRAYLRRHPRVRVTLVALSWALGDVSQTKYAAHAVLTR
jgi:hypothetical protein